MTENPHIPSDEFRANLEWQVRTALRREARFATPVRRDRRRVSSVIVLLIGLTLGAGAAVASAQVRESRDRAALLTTMESEHRVAEMQLQLASQELALTRRRFAAGVVGRESLLQAESAVRAAEIKLNRIQLNIEEINATGAAPRDEISAPLVGNRDFVKERLHLDLVLAQQKLSVAEQAAAEAERRVQLGVVDRMAALQSKTELARARADLELLVHTVELREQSLQEKQQPADVADAVQRLRLQSELQFMQVQHEIQRQRLETMRNRHRVGALTELDVLRAEVALAESAAQLAAVQRQLQLLRETLRRDTTALAPATAPS
jgi:outer membrane protein TolC